MLVALNLQPDDLITNSSLITLKKKRKKKRRLGKCRVPHPRRFPGRCQLLLHTIEQAKRVFPTGTTVYSQISPQYYSVIRAVSFLKKVFGDRKIVQISLESGGVKCPILNSGEGQGVIKNNSELKGGWVLGI